MTISKRHSVYGAYALLVALVGLPTLWALVELGREDATASHHAIIPLVSIALVYLHRESIFSSPSFDRVGGAVVIAIGLGIALFALFLPGSVESENPMILSVLALVTLWAGGFLLIYGRVPTGHAIFPLFLLLFTIPIPTFLLSPTIWFLKVGSTEAVDALFTLVGTPFYREEFIFTLPGVAIEVADQCSGIRWSIGLLLTILLVGHLYLKTGWKKALLVGAVVPLSIIKNGIRIVTLVLLSMHVNPEFLTGGLHEQGGTVFFVLALVLIAPLVLVLSRTEPHTHPGDEPRTA